MSYFACINSRQCDLPHQDDGCLCERFGDWVLMAVADGNGASPSMINLGSMACILVRDFWKRLLEKPIDEQTIPARLDDLFYLISRVFVSLNGVDEQYAGVYASLSMILVHTTTFQCWYASIGNSEIRLIRQGRQKRLTTLYTEAGELLQAGSIQEHELYTHAARAILVSALGQFEEIRYDRDSIQLIQDDILLLLSDGIFRVITPEGLIGELAQLAQSGHSIQDCVNLLLDKAESFSPKDNITLGILDVLDDFGVKEETGASSAVPIASSTPAPYTQRPVADPAKQSSGSSAQSVSSSKPGYIPKW